MEHSQKLTTRELRELHYQQIVTNVGNTSLLSQMFIGAFIIGIVILLITIL